MEQTFTMLPYYSICLVSLATLYCYLSLSVIMAYRRADIPLGAQCTNPSTPLYRAIQARSNFLDTSIIFLILLFVLSLVEQDIYWILGLGLSFVLARCANALSILKFETLSPPAFTARTLGLQLSFGCLLAAMLRLIYLVWIFTY